MRSLWSGLILLQIIGSINGLKAGAQGLEFTSEQHAEASSIMQALGANMRGLECFDMLMTEEVSHIAPEDDSGMEQRVRRRYICNFREGVHLVVASRLMHRFSLTSDEESRERMSQGIFVNVRNGENLLLSSGTVLPFNVPRDETESIDRRALEMSHFPDPRLIGSANFPLGFVGRMSLEEAFHRSFSPPFKMALSELAEKNRIEVVRTEDSNPNESGKRWRYLMDMERFVPLRLAFEVLLRDGDVVRQVQEVITWEDVGGLMVPLEIHGERRVRLKREWKEPILEHYDVVISWNSVNEADKLPDVDKSILSNSEALLRLLSEEANAPDVLNR